MWLDEKLIHSSIINPKFGLCCLQGSIDIPNLNPMPADIYSLISNQDTVSNQFRKSIRLYNSILSFTSSSAQVDESLMSANQGVYTYRINGSVHHKISQYLPNHNHNPQFSQIYIYDSDMQIKIRSGMFPKTLNTTILNLFQKHLENNNPYVRIYMQAGEILRENEGINLNIVLKANETKDKTKNTPTSNEIAALIFDGDQTDYSNRDVVVSKRISEGNYPHDFIKENLSMYDPLAYSIIHLSGEPGWQYNIYQKKSQQFLLDQFCANQPIAEFDKVNINVDFDQNDEIGFNVQKNNSTLKKMKFVSAREFYAHRLQDRPSKKTLINS